jgi:hypothetical protein
MVLDKKDQHNPSRDYNQVWTVTVNVEAALVEDEACSDTNTPILETHY